MLQMQGIEAEGDGSVLLGTQPSPNADSNVADEVLCKGLKLGAGYRVEEGEEIGACLGTQDGDFLLAKVRNTLK